MTDYHPGFNPTEGEVLKNKSISYTWLPSNMSDWNLEYIQDLLKTLASLQPPILFHCKSGRRSKLLTLLKEAKSTNATLSDVVQWAEGLNLSLDEQIKQLFSEVLK